jgi:hypothetical protein
VSPQPSLSGYRHRTGGDLDRTFSRHHVEGVIMGVRARSLCLAAIVLVAGHSVAAAIDNPRVRSIDLDVSFSPEEASMAGTATMHFEDADRSVPEVVFVLHGELSVESVAIGTSTVEFAQESVLYPLDYSMVATRVTVDTAGADLGRGMTVVYGGAFNPSRARSGSDYMRIDPDGVLLRAYYYSVWFPVFLDPDEDSHRVDFDHVVLRTPEDFTTVFTGTHRGDRVEDGIRISTWQAPDGELFAAQCTSRRFDVSVLESIRLYSERSEASRAAAARIAGAVSRLEKIYRRDYREDAVPGQLHVMQMPRYGAIASGNVVGITSEDWNGFTDSFDDQRLLAHELVHPFVQLKTSLDDPLVAMAVEGFPAYMHLPALAELSGWNGYEARISSIEDLYLRRRESGTDRRGRPLPPEKPIVEVGFDDIGLYKDSLVLGDRAVLFQHWLRAKMGPDRFRGFTRELFGSDTGSYAAFRELLRRYLPDAEAEIDRWLETTDYPPEIRVAATSDSEPGSHRPVSVAGSE